MPKGYIVNKGTKSYRWYTSKKARAGWEYKGAIPKLTKSLHKKNHRFLYHKK